MRRAWVFAMISGVGMAVGAASSQSQAKNSASRVYFGTYSERGSQGIYVAEFDSTTGRLSQPRPAGQLTSPSFVALHQSKPLLFAVGETGSRADNTSGEVAAYRIDKQSGGLKLLNKVSSKGMWPCHVSLDRTGKWALIANYGTGSVAVFPVKPDGSLGEAVSFVEHKGSGPNRDRQEAAHAHSINVDPTNRFAIAADLGSDKLFVYKFDEQTGKLTPNSPDSVRLMPGGGPRHFAMHPNGKLAVTNLEMLSMVTSMRWDGRTGTFTPVNTASSVPGERPGNSTAEVQIHPNGRFAYVSNRGHNSIAVLGLDAKSGRITHLGTTSTFGSTPRNFTIDPTGQWILAANQESDTVTVLRIDQATGLLSPTDSRVSIPAPVCVRFAL